MKLYHGTTETVAKLALAGGLKPRGLTKASNWKHSVESHPKVVYLTDAYPMYFAVAAVNLAEDGEPMERAAVIEIDTDLLNEALMVPDEDVLEQAGRGRDGIEGRMNERTEAYRRKLWTHKGRDTWTASLRGMGTCGYFGAVPPDAITRVAYIDLKQQPWLAMAAMDATISLMNYHVCHGKYRELTAHVMGDRYDATPEDMELLRILRSKPMAEWPRDGITVEEV